MQWLPATLLLTHQHITVKQTLAIALTTSLAVPSLKHITVTCQYQPPLLVKSIILEGTFYKRAKQDKGATKLGCVDHPIVLTEAVCNPLYSRQMMSELLFECYQVPKVSYGVDSLYSFYHNRRQNWPCSGLVISSGYQCTHILPVLEGRLDAKNCKRINLGGCQAAVYLQRLLQLKYPGHFAAITLSRMEEILHEHSYIAEDYIEGKTRCHLLLDGVHPNLVLSSIIFVVKPAAGILAEILYYYFAFFIAVFLVVYFMGNA
ncbi:hypothetical protein llap_14682 [Limosa lapponica baueri]|uniref:Uncharacterized protein n=1 Tax=Limosa lapponica baueri TaxID=1758121 RepID=A0A2I0TMI1_LIMLA|nr:hypothetical protein llap_14682 [Limosa lapponica baueri]